MTDGSNVSKEIDELIGSLASEPSKIEPTPTLEPTKSPEGSEEPVKEPTPIPSTVEDKGGESKPDDKGGAPAPKPGEGEPMVAAPLPAKEEPPVGDTVESLLEQRKLLLSRIEELTQVPSLLIQPTPTETEKATKEVPTSTVELPKEAPIDFLGEQSIDDIIDSKDKLNALLNSVYVKAKADAKEDAAKSVVAALPKLVSTHVRETRDIDAVVNDFYRVNKDLVFIKKTVAAVAAQVHQEKPELSVDKVFIEAADRTRKLLGLKRVVSSNKEEFEDPAFVDSKSSKKKAASVTGMQKEIDDILTY